MGEGDEVLDDLVVVELGLLLVIITLVVVDEGTGEPPHALTSLIRNDYLLMEKYPY